MILKVNIGFHVVREYAALSKLHLHHIELKACQLSDKVVAIGLCCPYNNHVFKSHLKHEN